MCIRDRYASDYWGGITRPDELLYGGINNGHAFKFSDGGGIIAGRDNESKDVYKRQPFHRLYIHIARPVFWTAK